MRTAAVLPVKRFERAKQRLGASAADSLRRELARAMVADVLDALAQSAMVTMTIVVSGESELAPAAAAKGAIVVRDDGESGQSAATTLGVQRALADGMERVLCVPGDCPTLDPAELDALLRAPCAPPEVVIVPDRHGSGTNGLLLTPPTAIAPAFGPDSRARHTALARAAAVAWRLERPSSLLLDIDTGADLAALRERVRELGARALHTRAVLSRYERATETAA